MICVVTGSCAGGGYELALAADHIMLVDDGSSTVSLPELPLLAVLPGTGGLTRVTDKRKVRRDHADVFCTTEEGIKGKRAVEWRLVDEVVPSTKLDEVVKQRAPRNSPRSRTGRRTPRASRSRRWSARTRADGCDYGSACRSSSRATTARDHHAARARCAAAGDASRRWSRRAPRSGRWRSRASSTTRSSTSALNELDIAAIVFKSDGDPAAVLAYDALPRRQRDHWLAREIRLQVEARAQAHRSDLAHAGRADRAGLVLRRHARRARLRVPTAPTC